MIGHGFPKLKEIQVQSKPITFEYLDYVLLKKRAHLRIIIDTFAISNLDFIPDEAAFAQQAAHICAINKSKMVSLSLSGSPNLALKILTELSSNSSLPLKILNINFFLTSEKDLSEILPSIQIIKHFKALECLSFDFRK